jgi:hypothetical protein
MNSDAPHSEWRTTLNPSYSSVTSTSLGLLPEFEYILMKYSGNIGDGSPVVCRRQLAHKHRSTFVDVTFAPQCGLVNRNVTKI